VSELFVLLVPSDADNAKHLQLLALVAEMFSDDAFRTRLLQASDAASIRSIFKRWIDRDSRVGVTIAA
jgi:mannitol/fructose-specific phosphotransferase system IIA component (Ntr-type)